MNRTIAALVSRGYAVIAPNPRGSTGYGKEFQKQNYQDLGGGDVKNYIAGRQWLIDTGFVDSKKIGITGGSYGGFMTLMAIGKNPGMWNAAVDVFGILNWMTMLKNSDPLLQSYVRSLLGDPEKDRSIYEATSPLKYLKNAIAPLLVLQGENDIRVPKNESEQCSEDFAARWKDRRGEVLPGGRTRFRQTGGTKSMPSGRTVEWFEKYLKGQAARHSRKMIRFRAARLAISALECVLRTTSAFGT